ncbi:Prolyl-tRNA synthetase associated domain-containing protein 1 [Camellia lanceoleosa]|uniref:Prolyl-tRNA synthetase associated domain-containing protein 1 n=1 Tax=Camellia lanceoleosa TaxID=1840588 RepID=A0ACC0GSI5_9ERIC|nr:Prolyl-tRNA synthetase associated domain-containing protein 1 [Camellia lanceoleosa]
MELQIDFIQYDHPIAKYVGHAKGALSKNLFLKFYVVSALADTKVDLKVLPQRLGLGKAGLRMALKKPLKYLNMYMLHVLLMDKGFKDQECCFFHPLLNDTSISLRVHNLDKFLKSIGKDPTYVDLEIICLIKMILLSFFLSVWKDQPPDLAAFVPSDAIVLQEDPEKAAPPQVPEKKIVAVNNKSTTVTAKAGNQSNDTQEEKSANVKLSSSFTNPEKFIEEILERTSTVVLSEIKEETIKQHGEQLGTFVSNSIRKHLSLDFINLATVLKKTAYMDGFHAATHHQGSRCP